MSPHAIAADLRRQEEELRQYIDRLASSIGERNTHRYPKLCEAAAFIEQSFLDAGYLAQRMGIEPAVDHPELAKLEKDVDPEKVLDQIEQTEFNRKR